MSVKDEPIAKIVGMPLTKITPEIKGNAARKTNADSLLDLNWMGAFMLNSVLPAPAL